MADQNKGDTQTPEPDLTQAAANLAARSGGENSAVATLLAEARKYRKRISELKGRVTELEGQVPGEGTVLLTGDDAKAYSELQATPAEIAQKLGQLAQLQSEQAEHARTAVLTAALEAQGWDEAKFRELVGGTAPEIEVRETEEDGKKVKSYLVRQADGAEPVSLSDWTAHKYPSLVNTLAKDTPGADSQESVAWTEQKPGGKAPTTKQSDEELEQELLASGLYSF
jgi:hypothetical protein